MREYIKENLLDVLLIIGICIAIMFCMNMYKNKDIIYFNMEIPKCVDTTKPESSILWQIVEENELLMD